jgi:hypothetical protein
MKNLFLGLLALLSSVSASFAMNNRGDDNDLNCIEEKICGKVESIVFFKHSIYNRVEGGKKLYPAMKVKFVDNDIFYVNNVCGGSILSYDRYKAKKNTVEFAVDFDSAERQEQAKKILEESSDQFSCITFFNNISVGKGSSLDEAVRTDIKL